VTTAKAQAYLIHGGFSFPAGAGGRGGRLQGKSYTEASQGQGPLSALDVGRWKRKLRACRLEKGRYGWTALARDAGKDEFLAKWWRQWRYDDRIIVVLKTPTTGMCKGVGGGLRGRTKPGSWQQLSTLRTATLFDGCSLGARYSGVQQPKAAAYDVIRPTPHAGG